MKKNFIYVLWILLFFGFVTVNCSAQSSTNDQRIVGTWIRNGDGYTYTYVFNANGSGTATLIDKDGTNNATYTYGISISGKIMPVEKKFTNNFPFIIPEGEYYFSPDGKTMIISGIAYRRK